MKALVLLGLVVVVLVDRVLYPLLMQPEEDRSLLPIAGVVVLAFGRQLT